nr:probable LRR receptor-like serine/threonine-protein kinase At3g47570 [Ziziphus jujuba var. spinosa]
MGELLHYHRFQMLMEGGLSFDLYFSLKLSSNLHGNLPQDIGLTLPNLKVFAGGVNKFTGHIPISLSNCSALEVLDFAKNDLIGTIPDTLRRLRNVYRIEKCELHSSSYGIRLLELFTGKRPTDDMFKDGLSIHKFVEMALPNHVVDIVDPSLLFEDDDVSVSLPGYGNETDHLALLHLKSKIIQDPLRIMNSWNDSIHFCNWVGITCDSSTKQVMILNLDSLKLAGSIPPSIGNLTYLIGINLHLNLTYNYIGRKIPTNVTHCKELTTFHVHNNKLIGPVPVQLSSLSKLVIFNIGGNNFSGTIPPWIGNFSSLYDLTLGKNKFQGSIPEELGLLTGLGRFQLHGNLRPDVGITMPNLGIFAGLTDLRAIFPNHCQIVLNLSLKGNEFEVTIPQTLESLRGLEEMDVSLNNLSGLIPKFLGQLSTLKFDNLSCNNFEGELPSQGIFSNATVVSVLGNDKLCGGIPKLLLPPCLKEKRNSIKKLFTRKVVVPVICAAILLAVMLCFLVNYTIRRPITKSST